MSTGGMKLLNSCLLKPHHGVSTKRFSMEIRELSITLDHLAGWVTLAKLLSLSGLCFFLCLNTTTTKVALDNHQ